MTPFDASARKKKLIERYNKEYLSYDKTRSSWVNGYVGLVEQEVVLSSLKHRVILEIGTGTGRYACLLRDKYYVGIDLSRNMLSKAKHKARGSYIRADGENLPFRERMFNSVLCSRTFRFIPNPLRALGEMHRVLVKGGRCVISVDFLRDFYAYRMAGLVFKRFPLEAHYRRDEITKLLKIGGFKMIYYASPFVFPETFYQKAPTSLWKFLKLLDDRLSRFIKGWFIVVVGKP